MPLITASRVRQKYDPNYLSSWKTCKVCNLKARLTKKGKRFYYVCPSCNREGICYKNTTVLTKQIGEN